MSSSAGVEREHRSHSFLYNGNVNSVLFTRLILTLKQVPRMHQNAPLMDKTSSSAIAERPCYRVGQFWPKVKVWKGETIIQRTLYVYLQPLWRNWLATLSSSVKKRKIRAITPFKVIQGKRYQSKACMRLPISD